jgi:hypothetical protein
MRRLRKRSGALLALGIAMSALFATPSSADDWGTDTTSVGPHPDGGGVYWCYGSSLDSYPALRTSIDYVSWASLGDPTQAEVFRTACDISSSDGDPQTDLHWVQQDLGNGVLGSTTCAHYWSVSGQCDRAVLRLNDRVIRQSPNVPYEYQANKTACHEQGHGVGLAHSGDAPDCMRSGWRPDSGTQWVTYSGHHINHINNWF